MKPQPSAKTQKYINNKNLISNKLEYSKSKEHLEDDRFLKNPHLIEEEMK